MLLLPNIPDQIKEAKPLTSGSYAETEAASAPPTRQCRASSLPRMDAKTKGDSKFTIDTTAKIKLAVETGIDININTSTNIAKEKPPLLVFTSNTGALCST